jgi:DNA mismatch repair protein MutS
MRVGMKGEVVFLHEVGPGTADRSYGIHVPLAGLPKVLAAPRSAGDPRRARRGRAGAARRDPPLFNAAAATPNRPH